jgi:SNF2 family DNA or RNA helicase
MGTLQYPFKLKPFEHQLKVWNISCDLQSYALFMDMGTGKSKVIIDSAAFLYDKGKIDGLLVLAPKGVYRTWYDIDPDTNDPIGEIPTHLPTHIKYYATWWSAYKTKEKLLSYKPFWEVSEDLHILLMNIEALSNKGEANVLARRFLSSHRCMMVIDESTTIKNLKAQRTISSINLGRFAIAKRIATGMPTTRSPMDLYAQCYFLDPHLLGFSSYYAFRARYAIMQKMHLGKRSFDKVVGYQRLDELTEKLKEFSFRITKEECLDLPPKLYQYREVELSHEQSLVYKQMKQLAMAQLDAATVVTATMVMVKIQKLHEITCGFLKDPVTGKIRPLKNDRLENLMEILDETSGKIIIWATYTYNIEEIYTAIAKEYGTETVMHFYGSTSDDDRELAKRRFQNPTDSLRFLVANPSTGRFGMTLTEAKTFIYYSNNHDLEHRVQSEDRAHRIGQTKNLLIIDLITRGTVDEKIIKNLREKKTIADKIMGDGYREWLK